MYLGQPVVPVDGGYSLTVDVTEMLPPDWQGPEQDFGPAVPPAPFPWWLLGILGLILLSGRGK